MQHFSFCLLKTNEYNSTKYTIAILIFMVSGDLPNYSKYNICIKSIQFIVYDNIKLSVFYSGATLRPL